MPQTSAADQERTEAAAGLVPDMAAEKMDRTATPARTCR